MGFRIVFIENEVSVKLKLNNLIINKNEKEIWIPISDINMIVLDNLSVSITARVLCSLAESNVAVLICDQTHLPIGYYSSYDNHHRVSKTIGFQINQPEDIRLNIWRDIVVSKLKNQAGVLLILNKGNEVICHINKLSDEVLPGDPSNREAHGAKIYFNELMGVTFSRGNDDILLNSGLDYGYSILRSYIARVCVGYGLNTQIGLHHKNEYNRFNLVDDLMEPFRPFVDLVAYQLLDNEEYFKPVHRKNLVNILNHQLCYNKKKMYLSNAIEEYIEQYAAMIAGKRDDFELPDINNYLGEDEDEI